MQVSVVLALAACFASALCGCNQAANPPKAAAVQPMTAASGMSKPVAEAFQCSMELAARYASTTREAADTIASASITGCVDKWEAIIPDAQNHIPANVAQVIHEEEQMAHDALVNLVLEVRSKKLRVPQSPPS